MVIFSTVFGSVAIEAQTFTKAFDGLSFEQPVYVGEFPNKPGYFMVVEQHAANLSLVYKKNSVWVKETFWNVSVNSGGEMGLLGFAFHPQFSTNRKFYVNYNPSSGGLATIIQERQADTSFKKDAGVSREILRVTQPYTNHNGGTIHFGPKDGFLYIGMGDGGDANDPQGNGQNKNTLLGKMLRLDVEKKEGDKEYGIPAGNPFALGGGRGEVFAYGLRNPFQWSFDPLNGDLWAGDVGQDTQEEVDIITNGGNYGWDNAEGYNGNGPGITAPVYAYERDNGRCIIGGRVFRGNASSKYYGSYLVTDHESRNLWALKANGTGRATVTKLASPPGKVSHFGTDLAGNLYVTDYYGSGIYQLTGPDWNPAPTTVYPGKRNSDVSPGRLHFSNPGHPLDAKAFINSPEILIFNNFGTKLASLTLAEPMIPARLATGVYYLRSSQGEMRGKLVLLP
jgi:glucose/arabinose dehydrogenase